MAKPGTGKCTLPTLMEDVRKEGMSFINDQVVSNKISDPSALAKEIFHETFRLPFEMKTVIKYTPEEVRTFKNRLSEVRRAIRKGKLNGRLGEFFFNTSARAKKFPLANKLLNQLIDVNYSYKGRQVRHNNLYNKMIGDIKTHVKMESFSKDMGISVKKAIKLAEDFDVKIRNLELAVKQGNNRAELELQQMRAKEGSFYKHGEGKVFAKIIDMIENKFTKEERDLLETEYYGPRREIMQEQIDKGMDYDLAWKIAKRKVKKPDVLEKTLHKVAESEPLRSMMETYLELMDNMYVVLDRGVGAYIKAMKISLKGKGHTEESIEAIAEKIKEKIRPKKEKGGFYPHFRRELNMEFLDGLMPHFENISNAMSEMQGSNTLSIDAAISSIKTYLSPRAKKRSSDWQGPDYSKNFIPNIKRYMDEIDRFNYLAHADLYTKQILDQSKELFKNDNLGDYGNSAVRLIQEMNMAMKGQTGFKSQRLESVTRSILGMQFVAKLGLSLKSAAKNASQTLLNFVEFGPIMWHKSRKFYRQNSGIRRDVDKMLEEAGLLFTEATPELQEAMTSTQGKFTFRIAGDKIVLNEGSKFQTIERKVGKLAGSTLVSGMMRKVENFNRKTTFKVAFYKMYKELEMNREYKDHIRTNTKKKVADDIMSRARNYAIKMTTLLHFDYSSLSKSQYLKHPVLRIMGQFQHYAWKFTEYNYDIYKKGLGDMLHNEGFRNKYWGQNSAKMMRMGIIYFMAPALAQAISGWNWTNLIEHDTERKAKQLFTLFTGDDDEIQKAFYGRGVATGFVGAPFISDILALGHLNEFWNMDEDSLMALITGYEDYARVSGDRKAYEILHILNGQLGRLMYRTGPMVVNGEGAKAVQFELGLYPDKETKEFREGLAQSSRTYLPNDLQQAFDAFGSHVRKGRTRTLARKPRSYNEDRFIKKGKERYRKRRYIR